MTYNPNFYSNFPPNFTFHNAPPNFVLPSPPPPVFFRPPTFPRPDLTDQDFVKQFDTVPSKPLKHKVISNIQINEVKEKLCHLVINLNELKEKEINLQEQIETIPEPEWSLKMAETEKNKTEINNCMSQINDSYLDVLRKLLAKRSAKRLRLKRMKQERKKEKEEWLKELEERSRKIDENLQKIKDDINRVKEEEEAKLQADTVLREVLHKKHDAKKCIAKLEALMRLYKARQNTARGRGQAVSERDGVAFNSNLEKLKSVWIEKLHLYETEEAELRAKLKQDSEEDKRRGEKETQVLATLDQWRGFLFGGGAPQVDFQGDVGRFVAVRSKWDQYIDSEGSSLPIGWVVPDPDLKSQ